MEEALNSSHASIHQFQDIATTAINQSILTFLMRKLIKNHVCARGAME